MGLSKLDTAMAKHYLPKLLAPIEYGENGIFFWFPGSGMTSITQDVLANRKIWPKRLANLRPRLKIVQFWGHLAEKRTTSDLLRASGMEGFADLEEFCRKTLEVGKEVALVVGRIDNFPQTQKLGLLKLLVRINAINRRRIHIILLLVDKPWLESMLVLHPEFMVLANQMAIMPILSDKILTNYLTERAKDYNYLITAKVEKELITTYGGILQLTKEYLRSKGETANLELKLRNLVSFLPQIYKKAIEDKVVLGASKSLQVVRDLRELGVWDLTLFKKHWLVLTSDPTRLLLILLTPEEKAFWDYCQSHKSEILNKEFVISILRPDKQDDVSVWAVDKAISRLRKKLVRAGIDPENLKTIKGRGYLWSM